jgi:alpha-galactosidase
VLFLDQHAMKASLTLALVATTAMMQGGRVTALDNGVAGTPPRGFSTWNAWPDNGKGAPGNSIDHATASRYLRGFVDAGLNKLGYEYFIVDEPCFVGRNADGTLIENKTTWPNGLKAFASELNAVGMKLGVYTCVGPKTCGGCIASEGHEEQDMKTFVEWGARYVKVDSCTRNCTPAAIGTTNMSQCGEILWSRYTRALNATGVPVVYSIVCNCAPQGKDRPWLWAKDFANSWRTNIDVQGGFGFIGNIVDCQRRMSSDNGSWCPADPKNPEGRGEPCGGGGGPEQYS